jgi:hypothetical protein
MTDRGARPHGIGTAPDDSHDNSRTEAWDSFRFESIMLNLFDLRLIYVDSNSLCYYFDRFYQPFFPCPYSVRLVWSWPCDNSWFVSGLTWSASGSLHIIIEAIRICIYIRGYLCSNPSSIKIVKINTVSMISVRIRSVYVPRYRLTIFKQDSTYHCSIKPF